MSMISENSDRIPPLGSVDSPSADEACNGGLMNHGGSMTLKKGPWTSAEDAILLEYVTKHGEGNWNAVQKHSGLARCGKSCRLRWANHLRPDLKKGAFTPEEERRIIELHAKMGNKWARMAAELPGRTDNEIKNYWNTRIKRQQRAGLPIYPDDISLQALTESKKGNMSAFSDENPEHPDLMPINGFDIPAVEFKSLEFNHHLYSSPLLDIPTHNFLDIPTNNTLLSSSRNNETLLSAVYPTKRLRQSESLFLSSNDGFSHVYTGSPYDVQSFGITSEYDENLTSDVLQINNSHVDLIGNGNGNDTTSSSEPTWAMKLELPSLQTPMGSWGSASSPLPSLESPPPTESGGLSPRNSGLLDAVLQESKSLKVSKNNNNLGLDLEPRVEEPGLDLHEAEWEAFHELNSPLSYSTAPHMFNSSNYMSLGESSLVDEPSAFDAIEGNKVKNEADDELIATEYDGKGSIEMLFSRPDFLLASN